MDQSIYLFDNLTGILYLAVGIRLLALYTRTRQKPELLLGINYLLFSASFIIYELPDTVGRGLDYEWCGLGGRVAFALGIIPLLLFTTRVFRPGERWAEWLVWGNLAVLFGGVFFSVLGGDFEGFTLDNPCFWFEWVGYTVPFAWIAAEALGAYIAAKKRVRLGLCKPVVANRYGLWVLFGVLECANSIAVIFLYRAYAITQAWPAWGDYLAGGLETAATGTLWLVFFSPAFYQRWVERSSSATETV
jgi:hypothetical protein